MDATCADRLGGAGVWLVERFSGAYGIAVATTMVITAILAGIVAKTHWKWKTSTLFVILTVFLIVDLVSFRPILSRFLDGGWFPISLAILIFTLMTTWKRGRRILMKRMRQQSQPIDEFLAEVHRLSPVRVPGTAVFMTSDPEGTPPALLHNLKHNKILHEKVALLTIITDDSPRVATDARVEVTPLGENFYRVMAHYGFMENPNLQEIFEVLLLQRNQPDFRRYDFLPGPRDLDTIRFTFDVTLA